MYIKDLYAISPQETHNQAFENGAFKLHDTLYYQAIEPDYLQFIPASILRRMGKAVRMGVGASYPLINRNNNLNGIVLSSAIGGLEGCIKFLEQIIEYDEGVLTPTNFVQSTPNALAGQLAIMTKNTGYNITHVNGSLSFENAMLDCLMLFEQNKELQNLLVGAVEEFTQYNYNIDDYAGRYKEIPVPNTELLNSKTKGSVCGEGSTMFYMSGSPDGALAEVLDVGMVSSDQQNDLNEVLSQLLKKHKLSYKDIDLLVLGKSGDVQSDFYYTDFSKHFPEQTPHAYFKHYVGDYRTSSAFALYIAVKTLNRQLQLRDAVKMSLDKTNHAIIYNHMEGKHHGVTLLRKEN